MERPRHGRDDDVDEHEERPRRSRDDRDDGDSTRQRRGQNDGFDNERESDKGFYDGPASDGERRRRRRRRHRDRDRGAESDGQTNSDDRHRRRRRKHHDPVPPSDRRTSGDNGSSDETEDLPPRFDKDGRKVAERSEDPLADKIQDMLSGKGIAGGLFKRFASDFMGDDKRSSGRR